MEEAGHKQFGSPRFGVVLVLALVCVLGIGDVLRGQPASGEGLPVKAVNIVGNEVVSEAYIRRRLETRVGQAFSTATVTEDQTRLLRTGKFGIVTPSRSVEAGEVVVTFTVAEKAQIQALDFVGNVKYKEKDLLDEIDFRAGDPLDRASIARGRVNIERLYREGGYYFVEVTVDEALLDSDQVVTYTIVEGPRVRVRKILFEGNASIPDNQLRPEIATKTYIWIFRTGEFDADRLTQDENTLADYYRRQGFLDAKVTHRLEFSDDRENLTIVFEVVEGTCYRVRNVRFEGNTVYTSEELAAWIKTAPGSFLLGDALDSDVKTLTSLYGENGYIDVRVEPQAPVFLEDVPDEVDLTIAIKTVQGDVGEGSQIEVGLIDIEGNVRTKDKVVRRELRFFPGEIYNTTTMTEAKQRLVETQLFTEESTLEVVGDDDAVRDTRVSVIESERLGDIIAGVGVTSDSGIVGKFTILNRNFDLFDWPRSASELFRLQAFRGAGQMARIQFEPSTEFTRFRIDFREPYLMDQPLSFGVGLYLFERGRDAYDERRAGLDFSFRKKFEKGTFKNWIGEIGFRTEYIGISGIEFYDAPDIRDVEGANFLTSMRFALVHDTTDSFFLPSRGHRFTMSWEQVGAMGGDFLFSKTGAKYVWHKTLRTDAFGRKSFLSLRGQVDQILGDAPVFERYYAGGIGSMRGFDFRGITPRDGLFGDKVGGEFRVLTGAAYSFPLYAKALRGVLFSDMGTVEEDFGLSTWRASVGFGLRLQLNFFGPVPLEFDLAAPLSKDGDDDTRIFNFLIGTTF